MTSVLARRLGPGTRVLNFAVPGYTLRQAIGHFLRSIPPGKGAAIILGYDQNDGGLPYRLEEVAGVQFLHDRPGAPGPARVLAKALVLDNLMVACLARSVMARRFGTPAAGPPPDAPFPPSVREPLEELLARARALGTRVLVAPLRRAFMAPHRAAFSELEAREGVEVLPLLEDAEYTSLYWDPHPDSRAHARAGARLAMALGAAGEAR